MDTAISVEINGGNVLGKRFQESDYVHRARLKEGWTDDRDREGGRVLVVGRERSGLPITRVWWRRWVSKALFHFPRPFRPAHSRIGKGGMHVLRRGWGCLGWVSVFGGEAKDLKGVLPLYLLGALVTRPHFCPRKNPFFTSQAACRRVEKHRDGLAEDVPPPRSQSPP